MSIKKLIKIAGFPLYSLFSSKIGFSYFYRRGEELMLYTRGIRIPVNSIGLATLEYYRHFVPAKGSIVFDVGGELGLEARQLTKIVGDKGKVYF